MTSSDTFIPGPARRCSSAPTVPPRIVLKYGLGLDLPGLRPESRKSWPIGDRRVCPKKGFFTPALQKKCRNPL